MKRTILTLVLLWTFSYISCSQNGWTQLTDYPGSGSVNMAATGYVDVGLAGQGWYSASSSNYQDWWQYNPGTNTWTSKASLTGSKRYAHNAFSTWNYAYVCLGTDYTNFFTDLWQYNSSTNSWSQKAGFPGTSRYGAVALTSGTKAYVGLGEHDTGGGISDYFTDFYEYDETGNAWTAKASFPGQARFSAFSFMINGKIFVVGGRSETGTNWDYLKDMWCYDIAGNSWTQKTSYPGNGSMLMGGFVLGIYGYAGMGYTGSTAYTDFWRYNPVADSWTQLPDFPGGTRYGMMYFNLGATGYLGCGRTNTGTCMRDFWKYLDPEAGMTENYIENNIKLYPVPAVNTVYIEGSDIHNVEIYTSNGSLVKHMDINLLQTKTGLDISQLAPGCYYAKINFGKYTITKKVIKN